MDWDQKGNMAAIALSAHNEDEYLIETDENGVDLEAFIRQEVEVIGIVSEAKGRQIISVKEMRPCSGHHAPEKIENGQKSL